jgi:hypothetical protein
MSRLGGDAPLLHCLGPDPFDTHQPGDAMLADAVPLLDQGVPDAGTAVGLTGLLWITRMAESRVRVSADRGLSGRVCHA